MKKLLPYAAAIGIPVATAFMAKEIAELAATAATGYESSIFQAYEILPRWAKIVITADLAVLGCMLGYASKGLASDKYSR